MYSNFMMKLMNILPMIAGNGAGRANGSGGGGSFAGGLANLLAWLGQILVNIVTTVWGWIISLLYFIVKLVLNVMDVLQFFVNKLVGIDIYNNPDWSDIVTLQESDLIIKLITSETVLKLFRSVLILSGVLLIIFCIIAIVKSNFDSAMGADEGKEGQAQKIMKKAAKSIFFCFLTPFLLIVGILGSNVVLSSLCNAINGDNNLSLGGIIFTTSAYDANKYRVYAKNGQRVPMYYGDATMVINMGDYQEDADMRNLFYYMTKGDVYIEGITEETIAKRDAGDYDAWYSDILSMDKNEYAYAPLAVQIATGNVGSQVNVSGVYGFSVGNIFDGSEVGMSDVATSFESDFQEWYSKYFNSTPLNDIGQGSDIRKKINGFGSNSNWYKNWDIDTLSVDFSATYYVSADNLYFNSTGAYVDVLDNTEAYADYETFATTPLEYFVMADVLDFAIEYNLQLYYVNADNTYIKWSDIAINDKEEDNVDISTYCKEYAVFRYYEGGEPRYYTYYGSVEDAVTAGKITHTIEDEKDVYTLASNSANLDYLSADAFYVSYYDGTNRLYWSEDGEYRERDGSTYIVCTKDADTGFFVPITQETTKFQSDFLASGYDGPIVARGIFEKTAFIPDATPQPTAIREQYVDENGNEVAIVESNDASSLQVINYTQGNPVENESLSSYIGYSESLSGNLVDAEGNVNDVVNKSLDYLWIDGEAPNLYINRNIKSYRLWSYADAGGTEQQYVTFYDKNGYAMPYGGASGSTVANATTSMLVDTTNTKKVYLYYICGKDGAYKPIVTYKDLEDSTLGDFLNSYKNSIGNVQDINLLDEAVIIKYEADLLTFAPATQIPPAGADPAVTVANDSLTVLVGARAVGISQQGYEDGFVTEGSFNLPYVYGDGIAKQYQTAPPADGPVLPEEYTTEILSYAQADGYMIDYIETYTNGKVDMYGSKVVNLYVKDGSVYYGNGSSFLTINDVVEGFYDYSKDYANISKEMVANVFYEIFKSPPMSFGATDLTDYYKEQFKIILGSVGTADTIINDCSTPALWYEFFDGAGSSCLTISKTVIYSMLYGQDFLIGLGASVQPLDAEYFGYAEDITNADNVALSFYTANNKLVESAIHEGIKVTDINSSFNADLKCGSRTATENVTIPITVVMKSGSDSLVEAVLINTDTASPAYDSGCTSYLYELTFKIKYIQCAGYVFGGSVANLDLDPVSNVGENIYIELRNGKVYCPTLRSYVLSIDGMYEIGRNNLNQYWTDTGVDSKYLFNLTTISDYNNVYIYFEKGEFGFDMPIDITLHTKGENIFDGGLVFRFAIGVVRTYNVDVKYRLEGGGCILNYNFNTNTGIHIQNLFEMRYINPLILLFSTAIVFGMLWNMVWNLIQRIYEIGIRFIVLPAVLSVDVLSEGKFKAWKDGVVEKVLSAYSVLIMLNLYFALIPSIGEITDGLISWDELPSTFTGLFSAIGVRNGGAMISNIGSSLGGISSGIITRLIAEISETSIITITGWLNKIIFMMFFLVLTTLVKQGPKILGKFIGTDADIADSTAKDNVNKIRQSAQKFGEAGGKFVKGAGNLAIGAGKGLFKGASNLFGFGLNNGAMPNINRYNISGSSSGDLHGSSYVGSSPITATVRGSRGSRYGAGGRAIVPETGVGGGSSEDKEETRKTSGGGGAMDMAHSDSGVEADVTPTRGGGTTVVYASSGGGSGEGGASYDEIVEPIKIDEGLSSQQLNEMSDKLMDEAATKRGEAQDLRDMASEEFTDTHAKELAELQNDVSELQKKLEDAQKRRGEAYSLKRSARDNGERVDAVDDGTGNIVNAQQIWEEASREVKEIEASITAKQEQMQGYADRKRHQADFLEEADRLEREAEIDDQHAMEYLEAAQDKELEEAKQQVKAQVEQKVKEQVQTQNPDNSDIQSQINKLRSDVDDLTDVTFELESKVDSNITNGASVVTKTAPEGAKGTGTTTTQTQQNEYTDFAGRFNKSNGSYGSGDIPQSGDYEGFEEQFGVTRGKGSVSTHRIDEIDSMMKEVQQKREYADTERRVGDKEYGEYESKTHNVMRKEYAELEDKIAKKIAHITALQQEVANATTERGRKEALDALSAEEQSLRRLNSERDDLARSINYRNEQEHFKDEMHKKAQGYDSEADKLVSDAGKLESEVLRQQTEAINQLQSDMETLVGETGKIGERVVNAEKMATEQSQSVQQMQQNLSSLIDETGKIGERLVNSENTLRSDITDVRSAQESMQGNIDALKQDTSRIESETDEKLKGKANQQDVDVLLDETTRMERDVDVLLDETARIESETVDKLNEKASKEDFDVLFDETARIESETVDKLNEKANQEDFDVLFDETARIESETVDKFGQLEQSKAGVDELTDVASSTEAVINAGLNLVQDNAYTAIDTKADAELTRQAIDQKADAGAVEKFAKDARKAIKKAGKWKIKRGKNNNDDDPDDDPNGGGGGRRSRRKNKDGWVTASTAHNQSNGNGNSSSIVQNIRTGAHYAVQGLGHGVSYVKKGATNVIQFVGSTASAGANAVKGKFESVSQNIAQAREDKLIEKVEKGKAKAEAKREAELEKEAQRQIKEREKQERAEERKIVRDAYFDAAKEGVSSVGSAIADGIKTGASAVKGKFESVSQNMAQAREDKLIEKIEKGKAKAEAKREAELEKEAQRQIKEREKQERADERRLERDAYLHATKEGISDFGSTIASGVKAGASAVKGKFEGAIEGSSEKLDASKEERDKAKAEAKEAKAQAKAEAEAERARSKAEAKEAKAQAKAEAEAERARAKAEAQEARANAKAERDAQINSAKETISAFGRSVVDNVKSGVESVKSKFTGDSSASQTSVVEPAKQTGPFASSEEIATLVKNGVKASEFGSKIDGSTLSELEEIRSMVSKEASKGDSQEIWSYLGTVEGKINDMCQRHIDEFTQDFKSGVDISTVRSDIGIRDGMSDAELQKLHSVISEQRSKFSRVEDQLNEQLGKLRSKFDAGDKTVEKQINELSKSRNTNSHNEVAFGQYKKLIEEEMKKRGL